MFIYKKVYIYIHINYLVPIVQTLRCLGLDGVVSDVLVLLLIDINL